MTFTKFMLAQKKKMMTWRSEKSKLSKDARISKRKVVSKNRPMRLESLSSLGEKPVSRLVTLMSTASSQNSASKKKSVLQTSVTC